VLKSPYDPDVLYMLTGEAADRIGVNRLTIQRWAKSGRVRGWRVGTVTLLLRSDIERERTARQRALGVPAHE
jgi:excisionase family DNA binding protein